MFGNLYCTECNKCVAFTEAMIHPIVYCLDCEAVVAEKMLKDQDARNLPDAAIAGGGGGDWPERTR